MLQIPMLPPGTQPGTLVHVIDETGYDQGIMVIGIAGLYSLEELKTFNHWSRLERNVEPPKPLWYALTREADGSWTYKGLKLTLLPVAL